MGGNEYFLILISIASIVMLSLGYFKKKNGDDGGASIYYSIAIVLIIVDIILFLFLANFYQIYNPEIISE
jgi:hypothetical protein